MEHKLKSDYHTNNNRPVHLDIKVSKLITKLKIIHACEVKHDQT